MINLKMLGVCNYILPVLVIALLCISCAGDTKKETSTPFPEGLQAHLDALKNKDIARLEPTVGDSVVMIGPDGSVWRSKATFMEFHKNWFKSKYWEWNYKILETKSSDGMGYGLLEYEYVQKDSTNAVLFSNRNYLVLIFERSAAGWQLIHDQNTNIPNKQ